MLLSSGYTNRVVGDPGAVFIGAVDGGNTIGAAYTSTLELTSGASAGTLSGFGTQFVNFAQTTIDAGASWNLTGDNTLAAGATLTNAGTLTNTGTLNDLGMLTNTGRILLNAGTLSVAALSGTGTIAFGASTGDVLALTSAAASGNAIANMVAGQTIEIVGQTVAATNLLAGNTLQVVLSSGGPLSIELDPAQYFTGDFFHFSNTGGNGFITENTTPCYLAGTRIRTDRGDVPVENLRIGDRVVTLSGEAKPIKWIGTRAYSSAFAAGNRDIVPISINANALGDGLPVRDLYVSPLHAMFLDDVLIQAEHLVNGVSIRRCPEIDPIRYFHIELERHDVVFAEDAPAETFVDCDSRGMFHNASEFSRLYPDNAAPRWQFCAPRIDSGPILARVRRRIDGRARIATEGQGPLQGNLDGMDGTSLSGWAFDPENPAIPVVLEILDGDGSIGRVTANRFRDDLEIAGIGDGRHGFELRLAGGMSHRARHEIRVRRVSDKQELLGSPMAIEPHDSAFLLKEIRCAIETGTDARADPATLDALTTALMQGVESIRRLRAKLDASPPADDRLLAYAKGPRAEAKRVLLIVDTLPGRDPAGRPLLSHIEALRALWWDVHLVASQQLALGDAEVAALKAWGVKCHRTPLVASVEEVLRRNRGLFDLVYLHRLACAETYAGLTRAWQPRARVIYGVGDLDIASPARSVAAMRQVDVTITSTVFEEAALRRAAPGANIHVVPYALPAHGRATPAPERIGLAVAVERDAMPFDRILDRARVTVAPTPAGACLTGRALESFAAGVPCVTTADSAAAFADQILDLYARPGPHRGRAAERIAPIEPEYAAEHVTRALEAAIGAGTAASRRLSDQPPIMNGLACAS